MAKEEGVRLYKIVLAGDLGVGKTSIFQRYDINKFFENKETTFGLDKLTKDVTVDGKRCKVSWIEAIRIHLMYNNDRARDYDMKASRFVKNMHWAFAILKHHDHGTN